MNRQALVLALGAALAFVGGAQGRSVLPQGVYSSVCVSPETLDLGGVEVQLAFLPKPRGTFAWCEGGCERSAMSDLRFEGDQISFSIVEQYFTERGDAEKPETHHFTGRFKAHSLILLSSDKPGYGRIVLRRQTWKPDHLVLASSAGESDEPTPVRRCK